MGMLVLYNSFDSVLTRLFKDYTRKRIQPRFLSVYNSMMSSRLGGSNYPYSDYNYGRNPKSRKNQGHGVWADSMMSREDSHGWVFGNSSEHAEYAEFGSSGYSKTLNVRSFYWNRMQRSVKNGSGFSHPGYAGKMALVDAFNSVMKQYIILTSPISEKDFRVR